MIVTLDLNQKIVKQYQEKAKAEDLSLEELLVDILTEAVVNSPLNDAQWAMTSEAVMAQVRALPPNPISVTPAQGSLLEALQSGPEDQDFDLDAWNQEWAQAEAEMKAITQQNDRQEGRG